MTSPRSTRVFSCRRRIERIGIGDVSRGQACHRHLIEKRLEEMVVASVDDRHPHRRAAQPLGRVEAAEAAPDDDDVGLCPVCHIDRG